MHISTLSVLSAIALTLPAVAAHSGHEVSRDLSQRSLYSQKAVVDTKAMVDAGVAASAHDDANAHGYAAPGALFSLHANTGPVFVVTWILLKTQLINPFFLAAHRLLPLLHLSTEARIIVSQIRIVPTVDGKQASHFQGWGDDESFKRLEPWDPKDPFSERRHRPKSLETFSREARVWYESRDPPQQRVRSGDVGTLRNDLVSLVAAPRLQLLRLLTDIRILSSQMHSVLTDNGKSQASSLAGAKMNLSNGLSLGIRKICSVNIGIVLSHWLRCIGRYVSAGDSSVSHKRSRNQGFGAGHVNLAAHSRLRLLHLSTKAAIHPFIPAKVAHPLPTSSRVRAAPTGSGRSRSMFGAGANHQTWNILSLGVRQIRLVNVGIALLL